MCPLKVICIKCYRNGGNEEIKLEENKIVKESSLFDATKATKIITHGWLASADSKSVTEVRDAYLYNTNHNVLTIDWSEISNNPVYPWVAASTRLVGKRVAALINAFIDRYNISGSDIHLIGHSLGAQVMGNTGNFAKQNLSRITGNKILLILLLNCSRLSISIEIIKGNVYFGVNARC